DPARAAAHQGRGRVLALEKRNAEALHSFERALALDPALPEAFDGVALTALHLCDWPRVAQIGLELASRIAAGQEVSPWTLLGYSGDAALQRRTAQRDIAARIPPFAPLWRGERYGHDRIRLAYISSDLRRHVVGGQIVELIARHDRSRFEVLGIATTPDDGSALRAQLVGAFDQFQDVSGQNPLEIARLLRALEVDVLVDLNGHTQSENFAVLAQRPAPVQASWLGYAGTTGADFLHQIVDDVVAPDAAEFSEPLLRLPHSFFVSDTSRVLGACPSRAQQGLPEDGLVFCSFNNNWKITAPVFALWMRLLDAVPGSVLWLRQSGGGADANLRRAAKAHGVAPERLVFAAREEDIGVHLARHALADLFLDTLPYNAHATACDALYAGLPVLTCRGTAFAGRVAASLLTAIEMPELIAESPEDYEALALALAREPARLGELRAKLAANRATAPLFDTTHFARDLEAALISLL
ncbi:MAG: repeat-containing protein, partial [Alphaproteobacteria bacterium]|nr:repeat-containing protein [Alphaproteobacteria bacterium]